MPHNGQICDVVAFVKKKYKITSGKNKIKNIFSAVKCFCHDLFSLRAKMMKLAIIGHIAYFMLGTGHSFLSIHISLLS